MRALLLDAGELRLESDHPDPLPRADEALVHVIQAGVCDTDLQLAAGYAGFEGVLGHEFVGRVDPGDPGLAGRRVVATINAGCGACPRCAAGQPGHCARRRSLGIRGADGVFAERVAVRRDLLVEVPDELDDDRAVFAEPLAAALHVLDDIDAAALSPARPALVLGDGKLGLLITMALAAAGLPVRCVGHHARKLELAAAAGAEVALESELDESQRGASPIVVEATGSPGGLARALSLCAPRGTVVLKSTTHAPVALDLAPVVVNELRLVGSRCGDMRRAIALLAAGALDPRPLIAGRFALVDGRAALHQAGQPGALKILISTRND